MKLKFEKSKGNRICFNFIGINTLSFDLWFSNKDKKWKSIEECRKDGEGYSSISYKKSSAVCIKLYLKLIN